MVVFILNGFNRFFFFCDSLKSPNLPAVLKVTSVPPIPLWEPHQFLADALMLQNDVGDVQTALAVLIVMGENRKFLPIEDTLIVSVFEIVSLIFKL